MKIHQNTVGHRLGALAACVLVVGVADAQLTPERTYYGVDRPIPFSVEVPVDAEGVSITLFHADGDPLASVDVASGRVDLGALFPQISGREHRHVHYAQLAIDGEGLGAPVVLQPMVSPVNFVMEPGIRGPVPRATGNTYSGTRAWVDQHVVLETTKGEIEFRMRPDHAPNTVRNFMALADGGFYTDVIFHRVVANANGAPFVIQVGDPTGTGSGGPGYFIDLEQSALPHDFGVLSMARSGDPNSNGSQVFVCLSRQGTSFLDGNYTAFGEAVRGAEAIRAIQSVPVDKDKENRPFDPPAIKRAYLVDAPPFGTGPGPLSKGEGDAAGNGPSNDAGG